MPVEFLSGYELLWLAGLFILFAADLLIFLTNKDPLSIYEPPVFVILFLSYYCIFSPLQRLQANEWLLNKQDFRPYISYAWSGAFFFYLALRFGYNIFRGWIPAKRFSYDYNSTLARRFGQILCFTGIGLYTVALGPKVFALLNPFAVKSSAFFSSSGFDLGALANFALLSINLLIPGTLLQFAAWVRTRKASFSWVIWTLISIAIYTSLGHRWRIVVLLLSQILLWFFVRGKRPSITVLSISLVILLVFSTIVEQTRSYGAGLSLSKVSRLSSEDLLQNRLQESNVFLVTGGLIASLPDNNEYVGFAPIISTALFPIPSAFWPEKNSFFYLSNAISNLFRNSLFGIGQAVLNYAEYYLMFGWPSLVIAGFLSGFLLRTLWNWFSIRRYETIAQVTYIATCAFLYMWISRGYLPQFILTLSFGSLPLFWYYYKHSRPAPMPKTASRSGPVSR